MRRAPVCALLAALLPACAGAAPLVTYSRTGGIAGEMTTLRISAHGKARVDSNRQEEPRRFTLSEERLARVKKVLRDADFATLEPSYDPRFGVVTDGITEAVTYGGRTVSASTGGEPPERFERVLAKLGRIAA